MMKMNIHNKFLTPTISYVKSKNALSTTVPARRP